MDRWERRQDSDYLRRSAFSQQQSNGTALSWFLWPSSMSGPVLEHPIGWSISGPPLPPLRRGPFLAFVASSPWSCLSRRVDRKPWQRLFSISIIGLANGVCIESWVDIEQSEQWRCNLSWAGRYFAYKLGMRRVIKRGNRVWSVSRRYKRYTLWVKLAPPKSISPFEPEHTRVSLS
jgi:hypothetical protein